LSGADGGRAEGAEERMNVGSDITEGGESASGA
jgi:hypothetical protein